MKTIGIFMAGQKGDILSASSVLRYREKLWGDCKIVWYIADENRDLLKHQDIELRTFPRGFGYPDRTKEENQMNEGTDAPLWEDWAPLVDEYNHLNLELKKNYSSLRDIDYGYWPAPHQMSPSQRHGIEYPNISKKVFGVPYDWAWHPVITYTPEERKAVNQFWGAIPHRKIIAIETFAGSGQSILSNEQVKTSMQMCKDALGYCAFLFVSDQYLRDFPIFPNSFHNSPDVYFAGHFPVRLAGLAVGLSDLLISVSSGITVAASAWGNLTTPILQYTGSTICSTRAMALGRFELVTTDDNPAAEDQYYQKLSELLNDIK